MRRQTAKEIWETASGPLKFESEEAETRFYDQLGWPDEMFYMMEDNGRPVMRASSGVPPMIWFAESL